MPRSEFDDFASSYGDAVNSSIRFSGMSVDHFVRGKARHLEAILSASGISSDDGILDIGCGIGQYEKLLGDRYDMVGMDMSKASIEEAAATVSSAKLVHYEGATFPFGDATFQVAFAICVVHHVPLGERILLIDEVRRVLRPGGLFLVYEHNPWNPLTRWAVERCVFDKDAILISQPATRRWLEGNGFADVQSEFLFNLPPSSDMLLRLDRWARRIPAGARYVTWGCKA